MVFLLRVMLVISLQPKVYQLNYISFGLSWWPAFGGTSRKYALDKPTLPSLWHVQVGTDLTQIEVVLLLSEAKMFPC